MTGAVGVGGVGVGVGVGFGEGCRFEEFLSVGWLFVGADFVSVDGVFAAMSFSWLLLGLDLLFSVTLF